MALSCGKKDKPAKEMMIRQDAIPLTILGILKFVTSKCCVYIFLIKVTLFSKHNKNPIQF